MVFYCLGGITFLPWGDLCDLCTTWFIISPHLAAVNQAQSTKLQLFDPGSLGLCAKEKKSTLTDTKIKAANLNSWPLNALFSAMTNQEFKKISSTDNAKEAWTILQNTYEGTKAIKNSKLQRLANSFEVIRMDEDESFNEFYAKLKDIVNSSFNLGEQILFCSPRLLGRSSDLFQRDSMPRSLPSKNQRILTLLLWQSWLETCKPMN